MIITYFGLGAFRIQVKNNEEVNININPLSEKSGLKSAKTASDILLISQAFCPYYDAKALNKESFLINSPGEYDVKNISIKGIADRQEEGRQNIIYQISAENISITHLGELNHKLSSAQIEEIGNTDILLVPVGGRHVLEPRMAMEMVNQIEPRIIIPMNYQLPGLKIELDSLENFIKEAGLKPTSEEKLKIFKKNLPQEDIELIVLEAKQA